MAEAIAERTDTEQQTGMFDPQTGMPGAARVPHPAFNWDTDAARESIRKLAALEPATAWPGHFGPLTGDVRPTLERIAAG